jgi:hypothetical protein
VLGRVRGILIARIVGLLSNGSGMVIGRAIGGRGQRGLFDHPNIDNHVVLEVFISGNECVPMFIFKTHTLRSGRARV